MWSSLALCALLVVAGIVQNVHAATHIVSRADDPEPAAVEPPTVESVLNLIGLTLEKTQDGVPAEELAAAVDEVIADVTVLLDGQNVNQTEVYSFITESSEGLNSQAAISALFDDALTFEGNNLATALALWKKLADLTEQLHKSGQETNIALAAIGRTAQAMDDILANVEGMVTQVETNGEKQKRQFTVGVGYRRGGFTAGGTFGWSRGRGWRGNVGAYYNRGGLRAGANYRFRG